MVRPGENLLIAPTSEEITRAIQSEIASSNVSRVRSLLPQLRSLHDDFAEELSRVFLRACQHCNVALVTYLLSEGAILEPKIPIQIAKTHQETSIEQLVELFQFFVDCGWDVNTKSAYGNAVKHALTDETRPLLHFLIEQGADLNQDAPYIYEWELHQPFGYVHGDRPLDLADSLELFQYLIKHGARIEDSNAFNSAAASDCESNIPIMQFMLDQGVDINALRKDSHGTALHYASIMRCSGIVKFLLEKGADPMIESRCGYGTPLNWAKGLHGRYRDVGVEYEKIVSLLTEAEANARNG